MNILPRKLLLALALFSCLGSPRAADCEDPKVLRFALIPMKNAEAQLAEYRPLLQVLEKTLERRIEIVHAASYGTVVEGLLAGSIDLAELGPASYAQAKERDPEITAFASPIQRSGPHTESASHYRSLLIVRRDKGFDSIANLTGASVSLIDPASTSGAVIPRHSFAKATGIPLERYFRRVTFAGSHDRAILGVQKGFVDAAFVSSSRLDEALRLGRLRPDEIAILWKSSAIPYDPFVYRGQLCRPLTERIKRAFFLENAALQGMFRDINIEGFARVSDEDYREIREIFAARP